jgi:hypothetical protein
MSFISFNNHINKNKNNKDLIFEKKKKILIKSIRKKRPENNKN